MNKKDKKRIDKWLTLLSKKLSGLRSEDRKDVIENYKDMWNEELSQGKSVNEILLGLKPVEEIAKELYEEFGVIKNVKGDVTKIKIINSKSDTTNLVFKSINSFFIKLFGFIYSITAILLSLVFFLTFVAIIILIPVAIVLAFINYEFLVVLPLAIGVMGTGIVIAIFFFFLNSSSYTTVKVILSGWFVKTDTKTTPKPKRKIKSKLMLVMIIISGAIGGVGSITSTVGKNSIYGSVLSNKYLHESESETFDLNKTLTQIPDGDFTEQSIIRFNFDWGYTPWTIFELTKDENLTQNTIAIQKLHNFKPSVADEFKITEQVKNHKWNKQTKWSQGYLDLYFHISAPWNAKFLSITPIKYEISYNFNIKGISAENIFVRY